MYKKSRKEIILENLPLVKKVASKIYRRLPEGTVEFEELVNVGVIGLMKAVDKYDETKAKFSTYAYIKIRGEILDFLRKLDPLPRNLRNKIKNSDWEDVKEEAVFFLSIEENLFRNSDGIKVKDTLASTVPDPEDEVEKKERMELLSKAIGKLSEKEQLVLQLIFVEELDLKSVAEILNISVSRVSQIKTSALKKLRNLLESV